jgi:ATP-dependent RNA helicase DeaD
MHVVRQPTQDEILTVFRKAGFSSLTPFQDKVIPLVLRGKDLAVESTSGSGRTVGFMLPLVLGLRGAGLAPRAVILASDAREVAKMMRAYTRFSRIVRDAPVFVPLGEIEDARREQRRIEKGATIVAGTSDRVIDHIRRGGLGFKDLQILIVEEPEGAARADFVKDVQFIFAKITERPQVILFARSPLNEENDLFKLLHHPTVLDTASPAPAATAAATHFYTVADGMVRTELLVRVILGCRIASAIVHYGPRVDPRRIAEALQPRGLNALLLQAGAGAAGPRLAADRRRALVSFAQGEGDVLLAPLGAGALAAAERDELSPSHVIFFDLPAGGVRPAVGIGRGSTIVALADPGQEKELSRLQEAVGVAITRREIPGDDEVLTGAIDRVLKRMQNEDKGELGRLRSRIRRQVPLLQRPLFMASLLKSLLPAGASAASSPARTPDTVRTARVGAQVPTPAPEAGKPPRGRFGRNAASGPAPARGPRSGDAQPAARPEGRGPRSAESGQVGGSGKSAEHISGKSTEYGGAKSAGYVGGDFTQLFVSIGRNRRVFSRDLVALFNEKLSLAPGDIGDVRVFEKYSFVDISPARAGEAIEKLSGTQLKGRTIAVNYAKKKEEKEET